MGQHLAECCESTSSMECKILDDCSTVIERMNIDAICQQVLARAKHATNFGGGKFRDKFRGVPYPEEPVAFLSIFWFQIPIYARYLVFQQQMR